MKKLQSLNNPIFEMLPQEAMNAVLGGDDWCVETTPGGTHPTFGSFSSDKIYTDGNGVVMSRTYCCATGVY